ncbi:PQQ-dependent sugar dehydrogenase [Arthrobacter sp. Soil763]|uniref:PQQ-dependent sugar dehydrogenase n=1 Tax=Arthrobacter sp. Soil763 TaxID=1736402 RepID=UPI0039E0AC7F
MAAALALAVSGCTGTAGTPVAPPATGSALATEGGTSSGSPATSAPPASGPSAPRPSAPGPSATAPRVVARINANLSIPWSIVFLPDGTALISERDSALLKAVRPGAQGAATTVGQVPGVVPGGEGGLLGLALSPGTGSGRHLYAYFTAASDNRIARFRLGPDGVPDLGAPKVIFSGIPKAATHNGGRIRFGPDGFLYVGTGDARRSGDPQDRDALGGKILRLTADGKPAPGNPFGNNPVYSLGHRNVQGLDWDSAGRLWASEFGPDVNDELNLIVPGGNYGWPEVTGAPHRGRFRDAAAVWPSTADSSPSGLEIVGDTAYLGALRGQRLWTIALRGETAGEPVAYFTRQYGRIRDVSLAPDGRLWALSNGQNPDFALVLELPG